MTFTLLKYFEDSSINRCYATMVLRVTRQHALAHRYRYVDASLATVSMGRDT